MRQGMCIRGQNCSRYSNGNLSTNGQEDNWSKKTNTAKIGCRLVTFWLDLMPVPLLVPIVVATFGQ